jgi:hypothetical protein
MRTGVMWLTGVSSWGTKLYRNITKHLRNRHEESHLLEQGCEVADRIVRENSISL